MSALGWICEALVFLYALAHAVRIARRVIESRRFSKDWNREHAARVERQIGIAYRLAEVCWTLSRTKNAAQRARIEADRDRLTRKLIVAFGMDDDS